MKKRKTKNKTKNIALITGRIGSAFNSAVIRGIEEKSSAHKSIKYNFTYHSPRENTKDAVRGEIISVLKDDDYDAAVIMGKSPGSSALKALRQKNIPVVFIEWKVPGFNSVCIDNYKCGRSAAEHFIKSKKINLP